MNIKYPHARRLFCLCALLPCILFLSNCALLDAMSDADGEKPTSDGLDPADTRDSGDAHGPGDTHDPGDAHGPGDADDPGDTTPAYDGKIGRITVVTEPRNVAAGARIKVSFALMDDDQNLINAANIGVTLSLNQYNFSTGERERHLTTEANGQATTTFSIEKAATGYQLTARVSQEDVETTTGLFDITHVGPDAQQSSISAPRGVMGELIEVEIVLKDKFQNPVPGGTPEFGLAGDREDYDVETCSVGDEQGKSVCGLFVHTPGPISLSITSPVTREADEEIEILDSCVETDSTTAFGGGEGTRDNPYRICYPIHLNSIGAESIYQDKYFVLLEDLDMKDIEQFSMIGGPYDNSGAVPFRGSFDGNHKTISNLHIDNPTTTSHTGLFRSIGADVIGDGAQGHIKNLTLKNITVSGADYVGAVAGENSGFIENVKVTGNSSVSGQQHVGGVVGYNYGRLKNVSNHAEVQGTNRVAGIAGFINSIPALAEELIEDAHNFGDITAELNVGGIVGLQSSSARITIASNTGTITGNTLVGGIAGFNSGAVDMVYNAGEIRSSGDKRSLLGGICGSHSGDVLSNAYNIGPVTGTTLIGGVAGSFSSGSVQMTYNAGPVEGAENTHALFGTLKEPDSEAADNYWDSNTSISDQEEAHGAALSTAQFGTLDNFNDWDPQIWHIGTAPDRKTRPIFDWQPAP